MINYSVFSFISGWVLWFLIDKHPPALGGVLPPAGDSLLQNFQLAFDLLSAGHLKAAYVYIWHAHYLIVSLGAGLLLSMLSAGIKGRLRRRAFRRRIVSPGQSADRPSAAPGGEQEVASPAHACAKTGDHPHAG